MSQRKYIYSDFKPYYNIEKLSEEEVIAREGERVFKSSFNNALKGYDRVYDIVAIKQALINLFIIEQYEVPGKPAFGNPLAVKAFELFDEFDRATIETIIKNIVSKYEPRANIEEVRVQIMEEYNRLIIEIDYNVIIDNRVIGDTIYMPFAANTKSYIDGRNIVYINQPTIK